MNIAQLPRQALEQRLQGPGLRLPCGPFTVNLRSPFASVVDGLVQLYADFPVLDDDSYVDFEIAVRAGRGLRRWLGPQVWFECDGQTPFQPLPQQQALAMLEWGLNWVLTHHAHQWLLIHAAVVERDGSALVMAADPGSGKSTLCAALVLQGWRLLSDEMAFVSLDDGRLLPVARPVSLKNRSIDVIRALSPAACIGPASHETVKGTVAHLRPPASAVAGRHEAAAPGLLLFPRYEAGAAASLTPVGRAEALTELVRHAFNYSVLGAEGFDSLTRLVERAPAYRLRYSRFEDLLPLLERHWGERQ